MSFRFFDAWSRILNPSDLSRIGRESGLVRRKARKLQAPVVFWSAVSCFAAEGGRTVSDMARAASHFAGHKVTRQAARSRAMAAGEFMRRVFERLVREAERLGDGTRLPGPLGRFEEVAVLDSTAVRLADGLARRFPACRTNVRKAALKIHARMALSDREARRLSITAETTHDRRGASFGRWMRGRLLLFDLGYFDYRLFSEILASGGHFLTRLKASADGEIVRVRSGCRVRQVGRRMNRAIYDRRLVDLDVRFREDLVLRVVGEWNEERRDWHWYVTSLGPEDFPAAEIPRLYALRWQIELLFREWKSLCGLARLRSGHEGIVAAFTYAALCVSVLARIALRLSARRFGLRWENMCPTAAVRLLRDVLHHLALAATWNRPNLRADVDELLTLLAIHAHLPDGTNAVRSYADTAR